MQSKLRPLVSDHRAKPLIFAFDELISPEPAVDYYDETAENAELERQPRDPAIDLAIERLQVFFDDAPQSLFYSTQIETLLERDFFHWIVGKGLLEMGNSKRIQRIAVPIEKQVINFYANRKHRYVRRELKIMLTLLRRIFDPEFTHAIGRHGELMFDAALGRYGFKAEAKNTATWRNRP
jgi:hypothetical protein